MSGVTDFYPPRDATSSDRAGWPKRWLLLWIAERMGESMAAIDDLRAAVADVQTAAQAEHDELDAVVGELGTVEGQLSQLQTQIVQGEGVTSADLEAITQSVTGVAAAARQAVESAKANPVVGAGAPAGGGVAAPTGTAPDPTAGGPAPTAPDPGAPAPTGGGGAPAPGGGGSAPAQSVYTFDGDTSTVDTTVWPAADVETTEATPQPLFHYSGDSAPGDRNGDGVGGVWHLYTGPTQPVGTGAAGGASGTGEARTGAAGEGRSDAYRHPEV